MGDQPMDDQQLLRYSRQIMLEGFDYAGQEALAASKVLIVGLGGLGCPVAMYLAAAGVGELWLADDDAVDLSNLQRQIAHSGADIGRAKVDSAADTIAALNPAVKVRPMAQRLAGDELEAAVAGVDLVVDASDNFSTRFALNRACVQQRVPLVSGAAIRCEGQVAVFDPRQADSPCYRCLYDDGGDDAQLSCAESGVLAPIVGVIGSLQALEAIKLLSGYGEPLRGRLLVIDGRSLECRTLKLPRDPECPVCAGLG